MIDLPALPPKTQATPIYLDKGGVLPGGLGAPDQRINRLGDRWGIAVTLPIVTHAKVGRQIVSRLVQAQRQGARMPWPLQGFDPGAPGPITVNGSNQTGSILIVDRGTPNYIAREGQFFSVDDGTGANHVLYMITAETTFNSSGQALLPIIPPIRVQHQDGNNCYLGTPMIEGFVQGDASQWDWIADRFTGPLSFEIHERR
jgi:hypothetical protein